MDKGIRPRYLIGSGNPAGLGEQKRREESTMVGQEGYDEGRQDLGDNKIQAY